MDRDKLMKAAELVRSGKSIKKVKKEMGVSLWEARCLSYAARLLQEHGNVKDYKVLDAGDPRLRMALLSALRGSKYTPVSKLAESLQVSEDELDRLLQDLEASGQIIERRGRSARLGSSVATGGPAIDLSSQFDREFSFGVVTDTHLSSKYERLDVLETAYDVFAVEGITQVFHAGNIVDGEHRFNKHELKVHGMADQCQYVLDNYPQRPGIVTYYVTGDDHEGWWHQREGIDFGRFLQLEADAAGREDLQHMGYMENDVILSDCSIMRVMHPGGGSSYAHSYAPQKIIESFSGGEKPAVLILGHYHKASYNLIRNVHVIQGGCTQDQTPFMRKKKLEAHVGFWVVRGRLDKTGAVASFTPTLYPFFDRQYYVKRDDLRVA